MDDDYLQAELDRFDTNINVLVTKGKDRDERIEELENRVADLERLVTPDPGSHSYDDLTREQKVFRLRAELVRNAKNRGGRDQMKYADVQRLFNHHPSPGHAYDLMELVGNAEGFDYNDETGDKRIVVKLEAVNDDAVIRAANKTTQEQPA